MGLVHHDPVGPARARPQILKSGQEAREEGRALVEPEPEQVDHHVAVRLLEHVQGPRHRGSALLVSEHNGVLEQGIVALGVDDAELVAPLSSSSAASSPVALFTPDGRIMTAPLLKMTWSSSPRSRMVSSTAVS